MRRVVVTGLGLVCPLGVGVESCWRGLLDGRSGIVGLEGERGVFPCRVAGLVPRGPRAEAAFDPEEWTTHRERRQLDDFVAFGLAAADMAVADAGWSPGEDEVEARERTGVCVGSGIGGLGMIDAASETLRSRGPGRLSPFFLPGVLINLLAGRISIRHGFRGPNTAPVTACSTGTHAIGDAARIIALGDADVMVAGGAESATNPLGIDSFCSLRALSTGWNDTPERASRPWDRGRDGFVMGEGAGAMVLESLDHARARGARAVAEVVGYGMSGDAHHITAPPDDGRGAALAMEAALRRAGLAPSAIDHVNAHATSTPLGDAVELRALRAVFGDALPGITVSSTKGSVGHLLGAAGAVEAIFAVLAIRDGVAPPTLNLEDPDPAAEGLDLAPGEARRRPVRAALSNSFGFGGTNASLVFAAPPSA